MSLIKTIFGSTWRFLRRTQQVVGMILFIGVIYLIVAMLVSDDTPEIHAGSALVFNPAGLVVEQPQEKEMVDIIFEEQSSAPPEVRMRDIHRALLTAKDDDRISALVLDISWLSPTGPANTHYIGQLIEKFKESGKPVYAYGEWFDQNRYLLATHADELYMAPTGSVFITGYGIYPTYYKDGLDKLGAEVNVFRIGDYKSAADGFMFNAMPEATKEASGQLINNLWQDYINKVSKGRGFEEGHMQNIIVNLNSELAELNGDMSAHALKTGMVDGLLTRHQWLSMMEEEIGSNGNSFKQIDFYEYLEAIKSTEKPSNNKTIAVIIAEGAILDGEQPTGATGGDTVARYLREARFDDDVAAVVLKVNSPGGSRYASEIISNEIELLKAEGKPVVASMGSYAASGGYWISANANEIYAMPTTITGSIGIFAVVPTFSKTLEKIGVRVDGIGTTPLSSALNVGLPIKEEVHDLIDQVIKHDYNDFLMHVSQGRAMKLEHVDAIGRGRVWSGNDALDNGLIDKIGNFDDALEAAARLAEIESYSIKYIEDRPPFGQQLLQNMSAYAFDLDKNDNSFKPSNSKLFLGQLYKDTTDILSLNDPNNVYAICLTCRVQ